MAPKGGSKKKRAISNNRGFSTTSVPSVSKLKDLATEQEEQALLEKELAEKVLQEEAELVLKLEKEKNFKDSSNLDEQGSLIGGASGEGREDWEGEERERHDLQLLVEKIRPGIDKEVSRMGKVSYWLFPFDAAENVLTFISIFLNPLQVLEYERRMTKSYPSYAWTEQELVRSSASSSRSLFQLLNPIFELLATTNFSFSSLKYR